MHVPPNRMSPTYLFVLYGCFIFRHLSWFWTYIQVEVQKYKPSVSLIVELTTNISLLQTLHTIMINSSPLEKMVVISQMIFSDPFSRMKSFVVWLKFQWLFLCGWEARGFSSLDPVRATGVGVTKAPFVNFSVSKIFDLANITVRSFESHSYLTGIATAELRRYLSNINMIFNIWHVFRICWKIRKITERIKLA